MLGQVILLLADEPQLRRLLRVALNHDGARLIEVHRTRDIAELIETRRPSLILADLRQSELAPIDTILLLRRHSGAPLFALSDQADEAQKIAILDAGADDYLDIPFSRAELLARVRASLRRSVRERSQKPQDSFRLGPLEVDFVARDVRLHGKPIHLTPTEYKLLGVLVASAGRVVTHEQLLEEVWGHEAVGQVQYLRVYMKQLRRKLELAPRFPRFLVTEPAVGYRLRLPA